VTRVTGPRPEVTVQREWQPFSVLKLRGHVAPYGGNHPRRQS